jgi:GNAT superfamily N-acetyltransferase
MVHIREYEPAADYPALRACFVELQSWERRLEPALPEPELAADPYLAEMLARCDASGGRVFVAEAGGAVTGFICVLGKVTPDHDEPPEPYSYISDLVVRAEHRGGGIGRRLVARAETFARSAGTRRLMVGVLVRNEGAHALYRDCGFRDYTVQLIKSL